MQHSAGKQPWSPPGTMDRFHASGFLMAQAPSLDHLRPFPTVIKDGVFDEPDRIRKWALAMEFLTCEEFNERNGTKENWPGSRGPALPVSHPQFAQEFVGYILSQVMRFPPTNFLANCSFQLTTEADGDSWVHRDAVRYMLAGLVYLNLLLVKEDPHTDFQSAECRE